MSSATDSSRTEFWLGLQTWEQAEWLRAFGSKGVCLDATHNSTRYNFKLITMIIFYVNRKRYHLINVQAICGPDREFYNIIAKYPGSTHDSRIFAQSAVFRDFEAGQIRSTLVGDAGYACKPYLLTPYDRLVRNPTKGRFNKYHAKTRVCIEQAFGCLKRRFHVLHGEIRLPDPNKVCAIITACCSLISMILLTIRWLKSIKQTISKEEAALDHWCAIRLPAI
uniref:DDE Tnp4 domain-containing protein n=1 Tax=Plectus sambesii TaxID=2011161 RepID=A0A914VFV4_9BILA